MRIYSSPMDFLILSALIGLSMRYSPRHLYTPNIVLACLFFAVFEISFIGWSVSSAIEFIPEKIFAISVIGVFAYLVNSQDSRALLRVYAAEVLIGAIYLSWIDIVGIVLKEIPPPVHWAESASFFISIGIVMFGLLGFFMGLLPNRLLKN